MMNYVGSISIIDRGDAPAQAVIDKNVRSLAQRVADETKDELDKVMDRVDNIYVSYEMSTQTMFDNPRASPNVEYIEDIKELEEIIKDSIKKKKYQQQVTIFIVGFQDACSEKMQLLQQVNQFFLDNQKLDEDDIVEEKPDLDLDECSNKINDSLKTAEDLTKKLGDLNQDIIEWLVNWANTKASNKGKKRLEKSLETAKNDMNSLQEKLLNLQTELEEKDEKFQQLGKQLDAKTQEALRYKTAAEVAKKSAQDNESHTSMLQTELNVRDEKIKELRKKLTMMEINLSESQFDTELHQKRFDNKFSDHQKVEENGRDENGETPNYSEVEDEDVTYGKIENETYQVNVTNDLENDVKVTAQEEFDGLLATDEKILLKKQKLQSLQEEVESKKIEVIQAEREMEKLHKEQLETLERSHRQEIEELKSEHQAELTKLTDEVKRLHGLLSDAEKDVQQAFDETDQIRSKMIELQLYGLPGGKQEKADKERSRESSAGKSYGDQSGGEEEHPTSKQESRPSTKDTRSSKRSEVKAKVPSRSPNRIVKERSGASKTKEYAEVSIQDDNGDHLKAFVQKSNEPSRQPTRQSKNQPQPEELNINFDNVFELEDEESWASVPSSHIPGRFQQYRKVSLAKIKELQDQLNITLTKTHRKVNSLKSQFTEHKKKWETERKLLIEQVSQAQKLQTEAEKEADAAMTQLEEFINEQEKLEDEEESKRQEVLKVMSRPGTVARASPTVTEQKDKESVKTDGEKGEPEGENIATETSDQELKKLMQQTDDAKTRTGTAISYDSSASNLAPWLTPIGIKRPPPREVLESTSQSESDPYSRLTDVADAEIQEIIPAQEKELLAIEDGSLSTRLPSNQESRSRSVSRQQSRSRPSSRMLNGSKSRSPTKVSRLQASGKFDETEENEVNKHSSDSEEEYEEGLAPWLTPAGVKKERRSARIRSMSSESVVNAEFDTENGVDGERSKASGSTLKIRSRSESQRASRQDEGLDEPSDSGALIAEAKEQPKSRAELKPDIEMEGSDETSRAVIIRNQMEPQIVRTQSAKETGKREKTETPRERAKSHLDRPEVIKSKKDTQSEALLIEKQRSQRSQPPEILIQESTGTFVKDSKTPREKSNKDRSRSPKERSLKERSRLSKEKSTKEKSKSPHRTRSSFEKVKLPEIRPRSFRSEGHDLEEEQKDSGIEQSDMSDTNMEPVAMEMVARVERTRSAIYRSTPSASRQQLRSRSRTLDPASDLETVTLEPPARSDFTKSPSKSLKSSSDDNKIQYLDNGTPITHHSRPSSRKTSLQEPGQTSRLTSDSVLLDHDKNDLDLYTNDLEEEELNIPGLSVIGGESVTDDVKTSRASRKTQKSRRDSLIEQDSVRSGAQNVLRKQPNETRQLSAQSRAHKDLHQQPDEKRNTIQSERRPSVTVSTVSPRKMVVTVDVLQGHDHEAQASRASGAISAPPAIEPEENIQQLKEPNTVREDYESQPVTPISRGKMRTATPSTDSEPSRPPSSKPKKAFATPRPPTIEAPSLRLSSSSSGTLSEVDIDLEGDVVDLDEGHDLDFDEGHDLELAQSQSEAVKNLKKMMSEENLNLDQQRTLNEMRSALKSVSDREALKDIQLERTVTILSLASQIARESIELGVLPDSMFNSFANMDSRAMSQMTDSLSMKGYSAGQDKGWSAGSDKKLWSRKSVRPEPAIIEQNLTERDQQESKHRESPFKIVMDETKADQNKASEAKQQERSNRHTAVSASKERKKNEQKKKEQKREEQKRLKREDSDLCLSGSMNLSYISSRGLDSFSDSLPRTCPSEDWQEMSQDATFSPIRLVPEDLYEESRKELVTRGTQSDLSGNDLKVVGKGMFTSSPAINSKKKRPITKEEMLYGEASSQSGENEEHDNVTTEDTSSSESKVDQRLSEKDSSLSMTSDLHKDVSLPKTPKTPTTRSSRALTPMTPSQRSRSRSHTSAGDDDNNDNKTPSRQTSILGTSLQSNQFKEIREHSPITPAQSVTSVVRPLSPESFQGEPSYLALNSDLSHHVLVTTATPDQTAPNTPRHRPVTTSSINPTFDPDSDSQFDLDLFPPPELCKATQTEARRWSEVLSVSKIEHEPISGKTEEEVRVSSAKSRASLRKEFKNRLEETRTVVEDRRAKSPAISLPSQKSLDDDQLIVEDEEEDDLPIPDDLKVEDLKEETLEAGTSPPPKPGKNAETQVSRSTSKQSVNIAEHPVVQEYLKTYTGVHKFKDTISRLLEDKDQMSASQILADIDTVQFDQSNKVQPQLENMTDNVYYVLNEVSQVINSIIHNDRGPVVSSLMMGMSRDPTQRSMIRERSSESVDVRQGTQQSQRSVKVGPSPGVDKQVYKDLQDKYEMLQGQLSEETKSYEEQLRHNTVVMMEMQDTINELQRELSALGKTPHRPMSETMSTPGGSQTAESAVMFTRLDSERNAKIMKKAVNDSKLDPGRYKEAMVQMDEYVNLPAQRLAHLVRKYVHHCRMKEIEENVKKSRSLNENVFNILDKMEELQNQRAKRWADRMDEMGMERLRIANELMETLDMIEQQSGIFLIKPMYSYRGREPKDHYSGKVSRPFRPVRVVSPLRDVQSAYAPAPTPASNMRTVVRKQAEQAPFGDDFAYEVNPTQRPHTAAARISVSRSRPMTGSLSRSQSGIGSRPLTGSRPVSRSEPIPGSRPSSCRSRPSTCKTRPRTSKLRPKTAFAKIGQEQVPTAVRIEPTQPLEGDSQGLMGSSVYSIAQEQVSTAVRIEPSQPLEGDSQGLMGSSVNWVGTQPKATWSMSDSQPKVDPALMMANLNTPRILELDINRMMIGQNTISAAIGNQGLSNDRLVNASNNNLRSYMTVNRPAVGLSGSGSAGRERPSSGNRGQDSPIPQSSPVLSSGKGVRIPNEAQFSSTPPLPPIGSGRMTPKGSKGRQSPRAPSLSPPGSSLRHSPLGTDINVEISTIK